MKSALVILSSLFSVLSFLLSSCENDVERVKQVTASDSLPVETGKDVEFFYSDSGRVKVRAFAPKLERFANPEDPKIVMPDGVNVDFYNEEMKVKSKLTANYAVRYEQKHIMEARHNVVVVNEKGETLNTEKLFWDEDHDRIYSDQFVKITKEDETIWGNGFESNATFDKYDITDITGRFPRNRTKTKTKDDKKP